MKHHSILLVAALAGGALAVRYHADAQWREASIRCGDNNGDNDPKCLAWPKCASSLIPWADCPPLPGPDAPSIEHDKFDNMLAEMFRHNVQEPACVFETHRQRLCFSGVWRCVAEWTYLTESRAQGRSIPSQASIKEDIAAKCIADARAPPSMKKYRNQWSNFLWLNNNEGGGCTVDNFDCHLPWYECVAALKDVDKCAETVYNSFTDVYPETKECGQVCNLRRQWCFKELVDGMNEMRTDPGYTLTERMLQIDIDNTSACSLEVQPGQEDRADEKEEDNEVQGVGDGQGVNFGDDVTWKIKA